MENKFIIEEQAWAYLNASVPTDYLRIGLKSYGCSGLGYDFMPVKNVDKEDYLFKSTDHDLIILVNKDQFHQAFEGALLCLKNTDFGQEIMIKNPNIEEHCGCGHSFVIKEKVLETT